MLLQWLVIAALSLLYADPLASPESTLGLENRAREIFSLAPNRTRPISCKSLKRNGKEQSTSAAKHRTSLRSWPSG
jgi:hypothetical protein